MYPLIETSALRVVLGNSGWSPPAHSGCEPETNMPTVERPTSPSNDLDRVESFKQFCDRNGVGLSTLKRLIARGEGPTVTVLSERRKGIRASHAKEWLESRAQRPNAA